MSGKQITIKALSGTGSGIPEAPITGTPYSRQDLSWVTAPSVASVNLVASNLSTHVSNANVHLSTNERNAINSSAFPPTAANPFATQGNLNLKENSLGNPSNNGDVLSSTTGGVRSWITLPGGGDMLKSTYDPTNISLSAFDMENMLQGTNNLFINPAQVISISTALQDLSGQDTDDLAEGATNLYYTETRVDNNSSVAANTAKVGITPTQAADIVTNNAKVTNATHIGDVVGDVALTIQPGVINIPMFSATGTPDGTTFLRGDNTWTAVVGGGISEAPIDGNPYSRKDAGWTVAPSVDTVFNTTEGDGAYYLTNIASDLGAGRYEMTKEIPAGGGFGIPNTGVINGDLLAEFASVAGYPNVTYIPSGPLTFYINAIQLGGTQVSRLYVEFYTRTIAGVNTLISTSALTPILTGSAVDISTFTSMSILKGLLSTDRLLIMIKADISGVGTAPDITLNIQGNTSARVRYPFEIDVEGKLNIPVATNGQLLYQVSPGVIQGTTALSINSYEGLNEDLLIEANNGGYEQLNLFYTRIEPQQDSPNQLEAILTLDVDFDTLSNGFDFGTNGQSIISLKSTIRHQGTGDLGQIQFINNNFDLGNSVDPAIVEGFIYAQGNGNIRSNCTISGNIQGYGFSPIFDIGSILDYANSYITSFNDSADLSNVSSAFYTSFNAAPSIGTIVDNSNYTGFSTNPNIPTFDGNGSFIGVGIYGNLGTFGLGGSYQGVNIAPNITSVENATGINVNMGGVTGTNIRAASLNGDVQIQGDFELQGNISAFTTKSIITGTGNPEVIYGLVSAINGTASAVSTNVDYMGTNNTMLIDLDTNSVNTSGVFKLGLAPLATAAVVKTAVGSSLDYINLALYALNLDGASMGGTVDRVNGTRIEAIPNGITTINEFVAYEFDQSFGQVGVDVWGLHLVPTYAQNFIGGSLNIGNSTEKVSNSDVALEIGSLKAFLNARLTTTERDALTAIDGMQLYNTTTDKLQVRAAGVWVDLH